MKIKKAKKLIFREYNDFGYLQLYKENQEMIINKTSCILFRFLKDEFQEFDDVMQNIYDFFNTQEQDKIVIKNDFLKFADSILAKKFIEVKDYQIKNDTKGKEQNNEKNQTDLTDNSCNQTKIDSLPSQFTSGFFIITEDCNNRCLHCYNSYTTRKPCYMTKETFDNALQNCINSGVIQIAVSGGEALIHPDIIYFLEQIKKSGLRFRLYSTLQNLTEDMCLVLKDMELSPVSITLYSLNPEIHDSITQNKGSHANTIKGLKLLKKYNIPFLISVPLTNKNIKGFEELFDYCEKELGAESVGPNPFISYTVNHSKTNENVIPSIQEIKQFANDYYIYSKNRGEDIFPPKKIKDKDYKIFQNGFYGSLTFLPDGSIVAGTLLPDLVLGNVNKDKILDVWKNSDLLNKWRKYTLSDLDLCETCPILDYCDIYMGDNWVANHDLLKCDTHLCQRLQAYYKTLLELQNEKIKQ